MDGSGFHFDLPVSESIGDVFGLGSTDGILYVEDFDAPPPRAREAAPEPPPPEPEPEPVFTKGDVMAAHAAGRQEGLAVALADAKLLQAQVQAAATQALADALAAGRGALERVAGQQAENAARAVLSILRAAVPETMARHAQTELDAVLTALLPGLRSEPELRVRAHPDCADHLRESLAGMLAGEGGVISVSADAALAPGDVQIHWTGGGACRDCGEIYADICDALARLGLPALEEICCGKRT
jgi:flagellar biosynthesis/type III secretory pathway protein FliH